jgi:hypothetical protein
MKYIYLFLFLSFCVTANSQEQNSTGVLPSDFFAGALEDAKASEDELGTQRLVEVKSSELTPSLSLSTSFKYVNNPEKNSINYKEKRWYYFGFKFDVYAWTGRVWDWR